MEPVNLIGHFLADLDFSTVRRLTGCSLVRPRHAVGRAWGHRGSRWARCKPPAPLPSPVRAIRTDRPVDDARARAVRVGQSSSLWVSRGLDSVTMGHGGGGGGESGFGGDDCLTRIFGLWCGLLHCLLKASPQGPGEHSTEPPELRCSTNETRLKACSAMPCPPQDLTAFAPFPVLFPSLNRWTARRSRPSQPSST